MRAFPWRNLIKPAAFSTVYTASAFGAAYYLDLNNPIRDPDAPFKTLAGIIAVNGLVFAGLTATKAGAFLPLLKLSRYTLLDANTIHRQPLSVLTCGFSHLEIWHLGLNMVALYSFGTAMISVLGPYQFLAFYTSGICWSSMAQLAVEFYRARRGRKPRPSLGASGGIYAVLGLSAVMAPGASVSLILLPFFAIPLGYAFTGLMAIDLLGIVRGWSTFGHAAHFGGGILGFTYGSSGVIQEWRRHTRKRMQLTLSRWGR